MNEPEFDIDFEMTLRHGADRIKKTGDCILLALQYAANHPAERRDTLDDLTMFLRGIQREAMALRAIVESEQRSRDERRTLGSQDLPNHYPYVPQIHLAA